MGLRLGVEFAFDDDVAGREGAVDITFDERLLGQHVTRAAAVEYLEVVCEIFVDDRGFGASAWSISRTNGNSSYSISMRFSASAQSAVVGSNGGDRLTYVSNLLASKKGLVLHDRADR